MKNKKQTFMICMILFCVSVVSAQMGYTYYEPHTMMQNMYYGSYFWFLNSLLVTVVLVLLIIYLIKLISQKGKKRR